MHELAKRRKRPDADSSTSRLNDAESGYPVKEDEDAWSQGAFLHTRDEVGASCQRHCAFSAMFIQESKRLIKARRRKGLKVGEKHTPPPMLSVMQKNYVPLMQ
jgi:hypothetical protein